MLESASLVMEIDGGVATDPGLSCSSLMGERTLQSPADGDPTSPV